MSDLMTYLSKNIPRVDLTLAQIVELYRGGYVSLTEAKSLGEKYARESVHLIEWSKIKRDRREIG